MKSKLAVVIAAALILALCFGVYWGAVVAPKQSEFWKRVSAVTVVDAATLEEKADIRPLSQQRAEALFRMIQRARPISPNHPASIHRWTTRFSTNQGEFVFVLSHTTDQGTLCYAYSDGTDGWAYGVKRMDDFSPTLLDPIDPQAEEAAPSEGGKPSN